MQSLCNDSNPRSSLSTRCPFLCRPMRTSTLLNPADLTCSVYCLIILVLWLSVTFDTPSNYCLPMSEPPKNIEYWLTPMLDQCLPVLRNVSCHVGRIDSFTTRYYMYATQHHSPPHTTQQKDTVSKMEIAQFTQYHNPATA